MPKFCSGILHLPPVKLYVDSLPPVTATWLIIHSSNLLSLFKPQICLRNFFSSTSLIFCSTNITHINTESPTMASSRRDVEYFRRQRFLAQEQLKQTHSLDTKYWISAANVSHLSIQLYVAQQREFTWECLKDNKDEEMEDDEDWWRTTEARRIIDATNAAIFEAKLYGELANRAKIVY